ncbi:hypothetical protein SKAU_G00356300 [Synaphobranchus kaupii]|uniref:Uncharacterized protein n=1 Tax=Synaphobranchus kaupii TaxID=118154 RepID=A0A9Q1EHE6_SYNKA|nr:hypothetical protein SKAU_G00356300 [Synaphobranchus kaupii]
MCVRFCGVDRGCDLSLSAGEPGTARRSRSGPCPVSCTCHSVPEHCERTSHPFLQLFQRFKEPPAHGYPCKFVIHPPPGARRSRENGKRDRDEKQKEPRRPVFQSARFCPLSALAGFL